MRNARHRTGDIGEAAFVLKSTQLGLRLARPLSGKESYDYISDNGRELHRVQVKAAGTRASKTAYHVTIARGTRKSIPYSKHEIDYLVIYLIPEDTFYVLPQKALGRRVALSVPSPRRQRPTKFLQHLERWDLLLPQKRPPTSSRGSSKSPLPGKARKIQASADPAYAQKVIVIPTGTDHRQAMICGVEGPCCCDC